jgi:hypothetical protein
MVIIALVLPWLIIVLASRRFAAFALRCVGFGNFDPCRRLLDSGWHIVFLSVNVMILVREGLGKSSCCAFACYDILTTSNRLP